MKLLMASLVCFIFMIIEIVGGYLANSLAIMTDAAHMLSDVAGFMISYFAIYLGSKPASFAMSFGYSRAEVLGALASIALIWGLIVWLFIEAIHRCITAEEVDGEIMLITSSIGLACNIINIFTLHSCGTSHHISGQTNIDKQSEKEVRSQSYCH